MYVSPTPQPAVAAPGAAPGAAPFGRGAFTFVLHSHLPYVRENGTWPHGEEWLYEALAETYLPLLDTIAGLAAAGIRGGLTIGLTPILCEQLADPLVVERAAAYLADRRARAQRDADRFAQATRSGELPAVEGGIGFARGGGPIDPQRASAFARLAAWYADRYAGLADALGRRWQGDVIAAFRAFQDDGVVEIATSAATHGYLPLLARDSSIRGQVREGIRSYERFFGRSPRAMWLPECAYRPAVPAGTPLEAERADLDQGATLRPGLEELLDEAGIEVFFVESQLLEGGPATSATRGELIGPYGAVKRRRDAPVPRDEPPRPATTYEAYWVRQSEVAVMARNERTGLQVWSGTVGYPGDYVYREFHKKDDVSGLQYWKISGAGVDLGAKEPWDPDVAFARVDEHAGHYAWLVHELAADQAGRGIAHPLIASAYDTELFGHWWFEGVAWIGQVLRYLAADPAVELTTASGFVEAFPPTHAVDLPEGSWGVGGTHYTWWNDLTAWFWPEIHATEARLEALCARELATSDRSPDRLAHLRQAAREALLLEASDWPFLVTTGQAPEYAAQRFHEHRARFERLAEELEAGEPGGPLPDAAVEARGVLEAQDNPFPDLDPASFLPRNASQSGGRGVLG
jgi:1,4-alpha-glucan branching enzyme